MVLGLTCHQMPMTHFASQKDAATKSSMTLLGSLILGSVRFNPSVTQHPVYFEKQSN